LFKKKEQINGKPRGRGTKGLTAGIPRRWGRAISFGKTGSWGRRVRGGQGDPKIERELEAGKRHGFYERKKITPGSAKGPGHAKGKLKESEESSSIKSVEQSQQK